MFYHETISQLCVPPPPPHTFLSLSPYWILFSTFYFIMPWGYWAKEFIFTCSLWTFVFIVSWSSFEYHLQLGLCKWSDWNSSALSVSPSCHSGTGWRCQVEGPPGYHWVYAAAGRPAGEFMGSVSSRVCQIVELSVVSGRPVVSLVWFS